MTVKVPQHTSKEASRLSLQLRPRERRQPRSQLNGERLAVRADRRSRITVNVLATQSLIAHFDSLLRRSADARVIGLTSTVATAPRAYWGAYGATKAAFEQLLDCYAQEVRAVSRIRVAIVNPGATRTAMRARAYPGEDPLTVKLPEVVAERLVSLLGEQFSSPHRGSVNQSA